MNTTPASNTAVVSVDGLHKIFRDFWHRPKVHAVNDLSFTIQRGEVFGLLGPNGSGKSTTIKMCLGLLHPTAGQIRILDRSPNHVKTKSRVGYLPEESYLYPYLTSEETLHFFGRLFNLTPRERQERIDQLLDMIGLTHARHRVVGEFSKGMARRIGLAQALINDPDLIILDEPTSGLDPLGCRQVKNLIQALAQRGKTVILSSHLLADVEDVCDRIAILYNGRIQAMGAMHDLLEQRNRYRVTLPENLNPEQLQQILTELRSVLGTEPDVDHPRVDLEAFFLSIIEKARSGGSQPPSGSASHQEVAQYLTSAAPAHPSASVLEALQRPVAPAVPPATDATPEPKPDTPPPNVDERLRHLTTKPTDTDE